MKYLLPVVLFTFPVTIFAAREAVGITKLILDVGGIIQATIPVVIGLAVLVFLWGVLRYIISKSPEEQAKSKGIILYGIIGLFVMVSVWGLVNILSDTLDLENDAPSGPALPTTPQNR